MIDRLRSFHAHPMNPIVLRARVMRPYNVRRFAAFGTDTIVHRPAWVYGPHLMAFGSHSLLFEGVRLSVEQRAWGSPGPALQIGDRVALRPYVTISIAESVVLEDDVMVGSFSSILDSDHTYAHGHPNVMHNPVVTAPVRIGRGTWIGERVAILKGVNIGRCCIVGTNSVVRSDLPDYSIAVGAPARIVGTVDGVDAAAPPFSQALW